ncbi:hypothetical protein ACHAQA_006247 [Verticillium albo-atrum]
MNFNSFLTHAASLLANLGRSDEDGISWVTSNWQIEHQRPFTIEWAGHTRPVTITLVGRVNDKWIRVWEVTANNEEDTFVFRTPHVIQGDVDYAFNISDASGKSTLSPRWQVDLEARQNPSASFIGPVVTSTEAPAETPTPSAAATSNIASRGSEATRGQPISTTTTESTSSSTESSSGLSSGAYIGIGIGAALGGVLIIGLLVWWLLRRKRAQRQTQARGDSMPPSQVQAQQDPYAQTQQMHQGQQFPHAQGHQTQVFEAGHGDPRRVELDGQDGAPKIGELESSYLRYAELPEKTAS